MAAQQEAYADAIELLRRADEIFVTDGEMARMGHALAVRRITPGFGWWHVETRTATEAR